MFRKMLVSAIIMTAVLAAGSVVYAQAGTDYIRDNTPIFELQSGREETKTFDREFVISGNAKEGTEVTIELYWFSQESEKSIMVMKNSSEESEEEGSWMLQQTEALIVGASSIFAKPVYLNFGKNKIVIFATDKDGNTDQKTLHIERFLEEEASKEVNGSTLNRFVEDISSINTNK
jgi:hypothetical protein